MFKIFLAIGHKQLEDFLKNQKDLIEANIGQKVNFVGEVVYREGILQAVKDNRPDVILIREGLSGNANLTDIMYKIKVDFPETRIIFIAGDRPVGDVFLATLVQIGIYDILVGQKVNAVDMLKRIIVPNNLSDVAQYIPKITVDENTNKQLFEVPDSSLQKQSTTIQERPSKKQINNINSNISKVEDKEEQHKEETDTNEIEEEQSIEIIDEEIEEGKNEQEEVLTNKKEDNKVEEIKPETTKTNKNIIKTLPFGRLGNKQNNSSQNIEKEDNEEIEIEEIEINEEVKQKEKIKKEKNRKELEIVQTKEPLKVQKQIKEIDKNENNSINSSNNFFNKIFNKKEITKRFTQQIITFVGGKGGVGNSQIAFNTAIKLSKQGYKVMYMDLNDRYSSIDCVFQLGYADVGIDTALKGIKESDYMLIDRSIVNITKIIPEISEENYLYKTYKKFPVNLDFMFFSQEFMEKYDEREVDYSLLKDLNMYFLMQQGYDVVILDAPYDIFNKMTELSLVYSNKVFFTITQDYSTIGNHINQIKIMDKKRIKFREKFYYVLNKYENANLGLNDVYHLLSDAIRLESFHIINIPNVNKDFINANYLGNPILWQSKNKDLQKAFSDIETLILNS